MSTAVPDTIPGLSRDEITAVFAPFVVERLAESDPAWREALTRLEQRYARPRPAAQKWVSLDGHRTPDLVRRGYESVWSGVSLAAELSAPKTAYFEWGADCIRARTIGRKRVHQLGLVKTLEWLRPSSALEVGFGYGLNLLLLSMQFPSIAFSGVELTSAGLDAARRLAADPSTPAALAGFAVGELHDPTAPQRLQLQQGSAAAVPLPDKSVDVAFTVLALEQMERVRHQALGELARVARRFVIMIEPFADWNTEPHRRGYIERHDYFASTVDALRASGLEPVLATVDMPNKLSFRAGLVVAEVRQPWA
jgi:ubiquinone/menaquinone biosynthesis C-methylase UbiE